MQRNGDDKLKLVNCTLIDKLIYELNVDVKIEEDTTGFINMRNSFQQAKTII